MQRRVKRNLYMGFSLSFLILLISSAASYITIRGLLESKDRVAHTQAVIDALNTVLSDMKDAETGQRGFLLTGNEQFLQPYANVFKQIDESFRNIVILTKDNTDQQKSCEQLNKLLAREQLLLREQINQKRNGDSVSLFALRTGKQSMDDIRELVKQMGDREERLLIERMVRMNALAKVVPYVCIVTTFIALFCTVFFYYRIKESNEAINDLTADLLKKEQEISERTAAIDVVAHKIADGDYSIRVRNKDAE